MSYLVAMQIGMIGLGRMGGNMVRRLIRGGHQVVVNDRTADKVRAFAAKEGATAAVTPEELVNQLAAPRAIWIMLPAEVVDAKIDQLVPLLSKGDIIIDGGNSRYIDDTRRASALAGKGIEYVDVGTSGGVWGLERGYCLMIGGSDATVKHLDSIFKMPRARARGGAADRRSER